jgi:Tol biopolymer transport system component
MSSYSISHDGRRVVFTSVGESGGDGIWVADLDRRTAPRQLTRGGEFRAFYGSPGEIIYLTQGSERHLYRMREDGSDNRLIPTDPVTNLFSVSPDSRWALVLLARPSSESGGTYIQLVSTRGENPVPFCNTGCAVGFGPNRQQATPILWSADGKSLLVSLQYVAPRRTGRSVILPYRSDVPLQRLWPKGLQTEEDIVANPGAKIISEANVFPGARSSEYLFWRRTTASNLYRIPLPN